MKERLLVESRERAANGLTLSLRAEPELAFFGGHFQGDPVLPGVVLLREAELHAGEEWPALSRAVRVTHLKFRSTVRPPASLALTLRRDGATVTFEYVASGEVACSGRIEFEERSAS